MSCHLNYDYLRIFCRNPVPLGNSFCKCPELLTRTFAAYPCAASCEVDPLQVLRQLLKDVARVEFNVVRLESYGQSPRFRNRYLFGKLVVQDLYWSTSEKDLGSIKYKQHANILFRLSEHM